VSYFCKVKTPFKHTITALFLIFILFFYNMNNIIIVVDFMINQDEIAKTLCVQKAAQKGCNGKCQLMKRLNVDVAPSSKNTPIKNTQNTRIEYVFLQPINEIYFTNFNTFITKNIFDSHSYNTLHKSYEIDTPPPVLS